MHGCMLALTIGRSRSGAFKAINDDGVIHELLHLALGVEICTHNSMGKLREEVKTIQELVHASN